jgi:hypothetical protein
MSGVHHNFCYINSLVKHTVWPEEVFQPEKASRDQIFFKHTQKPFPDHDVQLWQILLKLVQWFEFL